MYFGVQLDTESTISTYSLCILPVEEHFCVQLDTESTIPSENNNCLDGTEKACTHGRALLLESNGFH